MPSRQNSKFQPKPEQYARGKVAWAAFVAGAPMIDAEPGALGDAAYFVGHMVALPEGAGKIKRALLAEIKRRYNCA